jgi:hypothetical protein
MRNTWADFTFYAKYFGYYILTFNPVFYSKNYIFEAVLLYLSHYMKV